jgi:hypothetical protein
LCVESVIYPVSQSTNQSINQSINQSSDQQSNKPVKQSINQSVNQVMTSPVCQIDDRAYIKLILHTARYHWAPVIGLLIGSTNSQSDNQSIHITDVLPLCHNPVNGPITQIGLQQAYSLYSNNQSIIDQSVIGIYVCNDRKEISPSAQRLANQILSDQSNKRTTNPSNSRSNARSIILNIDSSRLNTTHLSINHPFEGLLSTGDRWIPVNNSAIVCSDAAVTKSRKLIANNQEQQLIDFEAHIDDVTQDWTNKFVDQPIST